MSSDFVPGYLAVKSHCRVKVRAYESRPASCILSIKDVDGTVPEREPFQDRRGKVRIALVRRLGAYRTERFPLNAADFSEYSDL